MLVGLAMRKVPRMNRLLDITAMMGVGYLLALVLFGDPGTALWGCTAPLIDKLLG